MRTRKDRVSEQPAAYGKRGVKPLKRFEPRYPFEEFRRRGKLIYKKNVLQNATPADEDKYVAIDIESGEFEMDMNEITACDRLKERVEDPQIWMERIGHPAAKELNGFTGFLLGLRLRGSR